MGNAVREWLRIDVLWVPDELHRKSYGHQLLDRAEQLGQSRGCNFAILDTFGLGGVGYQSTHWRRGLSKVHVMGAAFGRAMKLAALGAAMVVCSVTAAQENERRAGSAPERSAKSPLEEIIVRGSIGELRRQVWYAEELFFERFNEINSDDAFDLHCYWRPRPGSRISGRLCLSNSWRAEEANIGGALFRQGALPAEAYQAQQFDMQRRLKKEMARLLAEDVELRQAFQGLACAQLALSGETGIEPIMSVSREVPRGEDGLPFAALFEVQMGRDPWSHPLAESTFAIANVTGEIRGLKINCKEGRTRLEYQADAEWNVPGDWRDCILQVSAKRGTTFRLYEFVAPFQAQPE